VRASSWDLLVLAVWGRNRFSIPLEIGFQTFRRRVIDHNAKLGLEQTAAVAQTNEDQLEALGIAGPANMKLLETLQQR
jgi:hypothetical protein